MRDTPVNIAVFASGRGSNLEALLKAFNDGESRQARVALCISNKSNAGALALAESRGVEALHLSRESFPDSAEYESGLIRALQAANVEMIALAGYLRLLPAGVVSRWQGRIFNVHPAPLPEFGGKGMYGRHVHQAVLDSGAPVSGATVHLVTEEYDEGAVVGYVPVTVEPDDDVDSLAARVLATEHLLYPLVLKTAAAELRQTEEIDATTLRKRVERQIERNITS